MRKQTNIVSLSFLQKETCRARVGLAPKRKTFDVPDIRFVDSLFSARFTVVPPGSRDNSAFLHDDETTAAKLLCSNNKMSLCAEIPVQTFPLSENESTNLAAVNTTLFHIFLLAKLLKIRQL